MSLIRRLDWKMRWMTQEVLNFCGRKFGLTRERCVRDGTIVHVLSTLGMGVKIVTMSGILFGILWGLGLLVYCFFMIALCVGLLQLMEFEEGCDIIWKKTFFFRNFSLWVFLTDVLFAVLPSKEPLPVLVWLAHASVVVVLYAACCVDPPKKEKKAPAETTTGLVEALSRR